MPDETQIKCPHCGQSYAVQPEQWSQYQGRTINCTKCGQAFTVTAPQQEGFLPPHSPVSTGQPGAYATPAGAPPVPYGTYQNQGLPAAPTEKNGLAVTSLVLGIVLFCVPLLGGIAAIVTGIFALTKTRDPRVRGRGMAITGITLGGLSILITPVLALMISILLPALNRAREQANRVKCASEMKQIGVALAMYANNNGGQLPDDLKPLLDSGNLTPGVLVCPSTNDTPATGANTQAIKANLMTPGHLSYVYVGKGLSANTASPHTVLLYEPLSNHRHQGINVLLGDFSVEWESAADAQTILAQEKSGTRPIVLTPSP